MIRTLVTAMLAVTLLQSVTAVHASAQDPASGTRSTLDGVYTEGQARKGEGAYDKHCSACHVPAAVTGLPFRKAWVGRSAYDYLDLVRTTMPQDKPGKLSRGQYAEIVAYLFKLNGFPAGEKPLPGDEESLRRIRIDTTTSPQ